MSKTVDGKLAIAGNWGSSFWFGIINSEGNFLVKKTYPSYGSSNVFSGIANTIDGGFVLCGQNGNANAVLYKVDVNGNLEWNNTYSPSAFNSVVQTSDNGYIAGTNTGFLVKANANGCEEIVENYSNGIFDIISTNDKGFAVTGVSNGRLWLAKFSLEANGLPSPSPTVPELSWLPIVPLLLSVFTVAVMVRHQKTSKSRNVD